MKPTYKKISNLVAKAFSLIEISIVILIVGILIAGVTQGSRLVVQSRLKMAQNQTASSPVSSIGGLVLWLESTGNNFQSLDLSNGDNITSWNDINPQSVSKNNLSRATSDTNIVYKISEINDLPSVCFAGNSGASSFLTGSLIATPGNKITAFIVYRLDDNTSSSWRIAVGQNSNSNGWGYQKSSTNKRDFAFSAVSDNYGSSISSNVEIASLVYDGTNLNLYINGASDPLTPSTASMKNPTGPVTIGNVTAGTQPWKGCISEVIIFDSAIKTTDRKNIESYLGNKWDITMS